MTNSECIYRKTVGKISAQPHTTLCIRFLDIGNNNKKKYIAIGKTDLFYNSIGLCGNFTKQFTICPGWLSRKTIDFRRFSVFW